MYCPKCGTENPDDAQICCSCGTLLTPPQQKIVVDAQQLKEQYANLKQERKKYATLSFVFGVPGLILFPVQFWFAAEGVQGLSCFASLASVVLLFVGLGYCAR